MKNQIIFTIIEISIINLTQKTIYMLEEEKKYEN